MIKKRSFAYFDYKNIYQESKKLEGGESLEAVSSITGTWSAVTLTPVPARGGSLQCRVWTQGSVKSSVPWGERGGRACCRPVSRSPTVTHARNIYVR